MWEQAIPGAFAPGITAGVLLALIWSAFSRKSELKPRGGGSAFALGIAYFIGHWLVAGLPSFPPIEVTDWLCYFALVGIILGMLEFADRPPRWHTAIVRIFFVIVATWLVLQPLRGGVWSGWTGINWTLVLAALWLAVWNALIPLSKRVQEMSLPLALCLIASGTAGTILYSKSALIGQLSGVVASVMGACVALSLWNRSFHLTAGGATLVAILLPMLGIMAFAYAEMPMLRLLLLMTAIFSLWIPELPPFRRWSPRQKAVLRVLLPAVIVGIACLIAYVDYQSVEEYY